MSGSFIEQSETQSLIHPNFRTICTSTRNKSPRETAYSEKKPSYTTYRITTKGKKKLKRHIRTFIFRSCQCSLKKKVLSTWWSKDFIWFVQAELFTSYRLTIPIPSLLRYSRRSSDRSMRRRPRAVPSGDVRTKGRPHHHRLAKHP